MKDWKWKLMSILVTMCIAMPMWFFILYSILKNTNQDRLVWFIFWAYIPVTILSHVLLEIAKKE